MQYEQRKEVRAVRLAARRRFQSCRFLLRLLPPMDQMQNGKVDDSDSAEKHYWNCLDVMLEEVLDFGPSCLKNLYLF